MLHPDYALVDSRFGDVQIVSNLTITQATSHPAVDGTKNPDLFPKYLHNFTHQSMSLDTHAIWSKQLTTSEVLSCSAVSYWLIGIRKEELDAEGAPLFVEHLRNAQWKLGDNPRPTVVFHVMGLKAWRHRRLRWGDEYAHFIYIDAFAAEAAVDLGISLHRLEEVEQPTGAEPAQVIKLPTSYWHYVGSSGDGSALRSGSMNVK